MADLSLPARDSVSAQQEMFRRAASEEGLTIAVLHKRDKHLKTSSMRDWRDGAVMPAWAIGALGEAGVPDHLLSLIYGPFSRHVGTDEDGEGDLDTAADAALEFAHAVQRARSPKSPGGVALVPQERLAIVPKAQRALASIRRAAA
jgi:hypothetical protein